MRPDEVTDIFHARRWIEFAAVSAAEAKGRDSLAPVARAVGNLSDVMRTEDKTQIVEADLECHLALVRITSSERLAGM